jgi:hypothetical protein
MLLRQRNVHLNQAHHRAHSPPPHSVAMGDSATFLAALQALFGRDAAAQQQANAWLQSFSTTPAAWEAAFATLEPSQPDDIAFFCANLLLTKLRNEWHKLDAQQKEQVIGILGCEAIRGRCGARCRAERSPTGGSAR